MDEKAVNEYYGEKYEDGNVKKHFTHAIAFKCKVTTFIGEIEVKLDEIYDNLKNKKVFVPLYEKIEFNKHKNYQDDISITCSKMSTTMTYHDTVKEASLILNKVLSHNSIHRMVKEHGKQINLIKKNS
ncbi:MAG: hypothetical protein LBB45_06090 [Methanobrevibacter sp.]|jgi:hypothetical protein|nr:hypothetical protein [Candidatus Methanovirga basalitermitum]